MGSDSIPPKTFSDKSINQGLVCAHMHSITQTKKILTFMSLMGECQQQKHTQHAPSMKTELDYLYGWNKKGHIHKILTQNGEPQRYSWGMLKKKSMVASCLFPWLLNFSATWKGI